MMNHTLSQAGLLAIATVLTLILLRVLGRVGIVILGAAMRRDAEFYYDFLSTALRRVRPGTRPRLAKATRQFRRHTARQLAKRMV